MPAHELAGAIAERRALGKDGLTFQVSTEILREGLDRCVAASRVLLERFDQESIDIAAQLLAQAVQDGRKPPIRNLATGVAIRNSRVNRTARLLPSAAERVGTYSGQKKLLDGIRRKARVVGSPSDDL